LQIDRSSAIASDLTLERPSIAFAESLLSGLDEMQSDNERGSWLYLPDFQLPRRDFPAYLAALATRQEAPGRVPDTLYWAVSGGIMLGRISLRHQLNDALRVDGGNVGFIVRPSARGRGVASETLRLLLERGEARALGRLLLTCDQHNRASQSVIRKNGGVLEDLVDYAGGRNQRFWISPE
jgi:predicted acetyltransferase